VPNHFERYIDPLNNSVVYSHDSHGNFQKVTDQNDHETKFIFNAESALTKRTLPEGEVETFVPNYADNTVTHTHFNGEKTITEYDKFTGNIKSKQFSNGESEIFSYDNGKLTRVENSLGTTSISYNSAGLANSITTPNNIEVKYIYDAVY